MHEGHVALLPVQLLYDGICLRSKDPLLICGIDARKDAMCTALARLLHVSVSQNSYVSLPVPIFTETGAMPNWVQHIAQQTSTVVVVRVIDKFPGALSGFCRN